MSRFASEIEKALPILFYLWDGRVVLNSRCPGLGGGDVATVSAGGMLFEFARVRDELTVTVAPAFSPADSFRLENLYPQDRVATLSQVAGVRGRAGQIESLAEMFSLQRHRAAAGQLDERIYDREQTAIAAWRREMKVRLA